MALLYRRNKTNGSWVAKVSDGHGAYWTKAFAEADDFDASDGKNILDFYEAQTVAKTLARRQPGDVGDDSRPATVAEALDAYEADLKARAGSVYNARNPHLTPILLSKPVQLLDSRELRAWRDGLLANERRPLLQEPARCAKSGRLARCAHSEQVGMGSWAGGLTRRDGRQKRHP